MWLCTAQISSKTILATQLALCNSAWISFQFFIFPSNKNRYLLDKTETAGSLLVAVESHDDTLDLAAFGKEFIDLFLGGEEGEVSNVEGGRVGEIQCKLRGGALVLLVLVGRWHRQ